jgi:2Fe-2S ferredoxin
MPKIVVTDRDGNQHEVEGRVGLKVMETLRELDYGVLAICGGLCSCATCHVLVDPEWVDKLPERQGDEKELLAELSHYDALRSRLSCQVEFTGDLDGLAVTIAPDE